MYMRCLTLVLALGCVLTLDAQTKDERVRAKEPTSVTVYGSRENVEMERAPQPQRSTVGKIGHGFRTGAAAVGKGFMSLVGWVANVDDDVPRQQDAKERKPAREP